MTYRRTIVRLLRKIAFILGTLALLLLVFLNLSPQGRTATRTLGLVLQVIPAVPVKPQEWFTDNPSREKIKYPRSDGTGLADIYRIQNGSKRAAILLFLGVNPAGRDDPRVINLGTALAHSGFVVMVPWSETMANKKVDPDDIDSLVHAFQYLSRLEYVDAKRIAMTGFCVGSSMVTVAAQDPRINDQVALINHFSGYYDGRDFLKQIASKSSFYNGAVEPWEPGHLTFNVFINHLIDSLENPTDREHLSHAFLEGDNTIQLSLESLTHQGQAVYHLLSGVTLKEAEDVISQLPQKFLDDLDAISPRTNLSNLKARIFIMHDREDDAAPVEESRRLADALRDHNNVKYTEFSFFQHVDPTGSLAPVTFIPEALKLYRHLYGIISLAN